MSKRFLFAVWLVLTAMVPARADDKETLKRDKPAVVVRLAALDQLRSDLRYLGEAIGQTEKAKQLDGLIRSKLGEKGLAGIDTKKPIGLYGWVGSFGIDSKVVLLLPVADTKSFLDLISDTLDVKPEKGDDEVYTMNVDRVPFPVYFRFANGYAYVTAGEKKLLDKDKLLAPAVVWPAGQVGVVSLTVNIDEVPDDLKEKALAVMENQLADLKDREMPTHSKAQKKFRDAAIDELGAQIKSLFQQGGAATLRLELDRKQNELSLTALVAGKPGSPLANKIRDWGQMQSWTAALLHTDSAFQGELNMGLPEKLRTLLGPALKDTEKQVLARAKNEDEREVLNTLLEGIMPTLKAAELDTAFDLRGPSDQGLYTLVAGMKIKESAKMERSFLKAAARFPKQVNLDAEKAGSVNIHRINPDKKLKSSTQRTFGDHPMYVAFHRDLLFLSAGEEGLSALKEALATTPRTGKVMELQMKLAHMAPLFDNPTQADVARQVFGSHKDDDRIRISVEGGDVLKLHLSLKAKLIEYVSRIEKAKKK